MQNLPMVSAFSLLFFLGIGLFFFALFILVGHYLVMWWLGINEVLAEQRATVKELRALRADIAALNAPPPALP